MEYLNFEEWAEVWLEEKKIFVKESTYANYSVALMNHLIPAFGNCTFEEINSAVVQRQVIEWMKRGRRDASGGLAEKTVRDLIIILKNCIRDWSIATSQKYNRIQVRYGKSYGVEKLHTLSKEELRHIVECMKTENGCEILGCAIAIYTGMRIGEVCALQWKDVDFINHLICVKKTLQRIYTKNFEGKSNSKIIITTPKSQKSIREIPISNTLYPMLKRYACTDGECYVLTGTEKFIEPRIYRKHYEAFLKRNNIRHVCFHDLRHTFATCCIESGADCKVVSELLGHASVNTTLNLYVHPHLEDKRACVELI